MKLKKIAIILLTIILCTSSISAERFSNLFIAVLQSNGEWEYMKVSDSNDKVWVWIFNQNNGCKHKQTWRLNPKAWNVPGNYTSLRIEEVQNLYKETHRSTSDFAINIEFDFLEKHIDYAVYGCGVAAWHYSDFSGVGYLVQFLMSDDVTEKSCIETFLNEERSSIKEVYN